MCINNDTINKTRLDFPKHHQVVNDDEKFYIELKKYD